MKLLVRFFLSLCILLLSSYSQPHAQTHQAGIGYALLKIRGKPVYTGISILQQKSSLVIKPFSSDKKNVDEKIRATDQEEEDHINSIRKYIEISTLFTTVFYTQIPEFFWQHVKKRLAFCKHFSYFLPFNWYLVLQVIRL